MEYDTKQSELTFDSEDGNNIDNHYLHAIEAYIFASEYPVEFKKLQLIVPQAKNLRIYLDILEKQYAHRGIQFVKRGTAWCFRTNPYYANWLSDFRKEEQTLTPVTLEILSIIAYHQPITRTEIETIRGVSVSKKIIDTLLDLDWIAVKGTRNVIGKPMLWGTTTQFLDHFGLKDISELPGLTDLRKSGLIDMHPPE